MREGRGGRPRLLVYNKPYGVCGQQHGIVQELCESRGGRPGLFVLTSLQWTQRFIEPFFGIGHNLSLICQLTSEDIKHQFIIMWTASASRFGLAVRR